MKSQRTKPGNVTNTIGLIFLGNIIPSIRPLRGRRQARSQGLTDRTVSCLGLQDKIDVSIDCYERRSQVPDMIFHRVETNSMAQDSPLAVGESPLSLRQETNSLRILLPETQIRTVIECVQDS